MPQIVASHLDEYRYPKTINMTFMPDPLTPSPGGANLYMQLSRKPLTTGLYGVSRMYYTDLDTVFNEE